MGWRMGKRNCGHGERDTRCWVPTPSCYQRARRGKCAKVNVHHVTHADRRAHAPEKHRLHLVADESKCKGTARARKQSLEPAVFVDLCSLQTLHRVGDRSVFQACVRSVHGEASRQNLELMTISDGVDGEIHHGMDSFTSFLRSGINPYFVKAPLTSTLFFSAT